MATYETQQQTMRRRVPNPRREPSVWIDIPWDEDNKAAFRRVTFSSGNKKRACVYFKSKPGSGGLFTDEVDLEKTYSLVKKRSEDHPSSSWQAKKIIKTRTEHIDTIDSPVFDDGHKNEKRGNKKDGCLVRLLRLIILIGFIIFLIITFLEVL